MNSSGITEHSLVSIQVSNDSGFDLDPNDSKTGLGSQKIVTSTPQSQSKPMDMLNNDSGYISHTLESNSDFSTDFQKDSQQMVEATKNMPIYLSEDALLEKPDIKTTTEYYENLQGNKNCYSDSSSLCTFSTFDCNLSSNSIVESSDVSCSTNLSGLELDSSTSSNRSNEIIKVEPIVCKFTNREEIGCTSGVPITPQKAYKNKVDPGISPELFCDEDEIEDADDCILSQKCVAGEKYIVMNDRKLLKRVNDGLNGVLPPPSVTVVHLSAEEMLSKISKNEHLFWAEKQLDCNSKSLLVTGREYDSIHKSWPEILEPRYHGLHYNRSKLSEEFESLCAKYASRYVGSETQSTCTVFENNQSSPSKKKANKLRWVVKSPGRRLSHLARRRITFTSTNLNSSASTSNIGTRARQILVDARKMELLNRRKSPRKTPKKTPGKSPRKRGRTPSSSAKKRLAMQLRLLSEEEEPPVSAISSARASVTKRALFQSPEHAKNNNLLLSKSKSVLSSSIKKSTPKRALFKSPVKNSPTKGNLYEKKRKRSESDDSQPLKLCKTVPFQSDSSCENRDPSSQIGASSQSHPMELSANHKKKLQWAIYEALRSQNIGISHPQFKPYASVLARVTRRFLPNLSANAPRPEGGTSERMLRIARQHVFAVTKGKSVEEIVLEYERARAKCFKPTGYVSKNDENKMRDIAQARHKENVLQDKLNIMNSVDKKRPDNDVLKQKLFGNENRLDRIRKVIDFGDGGGGGTSNR